MASGDLVAVWELSQPDGNYRIEFEHGTTSGKRVIRVNGKEIYREDWMFKLVGKEHFTAGKAKCTIGIEAVAGFQYEYTLEVNGKSLKKFKENQAKIMKCWRFLVDDKGTTEYRIVLAKDTLDVWVNGNRVETTEEFTDDGCETHFVIGVGDILHSACIRAASSGKRRTGIIHTLAVDDRDIPEATEGYTKQ